MKSHEILHIFTPHGKTFTFRDVTIVCDNESFLTFNYTAASDGKIKTGNFPKSGICGWSLATGDQRKSS